MGISSVLHPVVAVLPVGAVIGCMPLERMAFITWIVAMLFHSAAPTPRGGVRSSAKRSMLHRVLAMATAVALCVARGQRYVVQ